MLFNANCQIVEQTRAVESGEPLQREHDTTTHDTQRCSFRKLNLTGALTALGALTVQGWRCRLQSTLDIQVGWRVLVTPDGKTTATEYVIRSAQKVFHWDLVLEAA